MMTFEGTFGPDALPNVRFLIQNSSFLIQNSSFLMQNSSFLMQKLIIINTKHPPPHFDLFRLRWILFKNENELAQRNIKRSSFLACSWVILGVCFACTAGRLADRRLRAFLWLVRNACNPRPQLGFQGDF